MNDEQEETTNRICDWECNPLKKYGPGIQDKIKKYERSQEHRSFGQYTIL